MAETTNPHTPSPTEVWPYTHEARQELAGAFIAALLLLLIIIATAINAALPSPEETYRDAISDIRCDAPRTKQEARWCATAVQP